jgi:N4-gp56 family major capsid protein
MGNKWIVDADGGYLANPELSKKLRYYAQPMLKFGQFVRRESAFGKNKNDSWDFDKIGNIVTAASQTGIAENNTMPESKFRVIRSSGTVTEYGNSIPYSGKLEALAEFDPNNIAQRVLLNDQATILDAIIASYFKACKYIYTPATSAGVGVFEQPANGIPTLDWDQNFTYGNAEEVVDKLKSLHVPPYDGENYICIGSVKALRSIKQQTEWKDAAKYGDPDRLFHGEVGMIDGVRYIECNNALALQDHPEGGTRGGEMVYFGEDPCVEGVAIPPEIRAKIPTDYGRSKGVAWYALMGWATPWRWTATTEEQTRAIWVTDGTNFTLRAPSGY